MLEMLRELEVRTVIPGHGAPFGDFAAAVPRAEIGNYFGKVAIFRDVSKRYFNKEPAAVAAQMIAELLKAGVLEEEDGDIVARG